MYTSNRVLDLNNEQDVELGAQAICDEALGLINGPTGAIWGRVERGGRDYDFEDVVARLKGRHGQAIALTIPSDEFLSLLDPSQIHPEIHPLIESGEAMNSYFGATSFVRAAAKVSTLDDAGIPESARSKEDIVVNGVAYRLVQNWTAEGKPNTQKLLTRARQLGAHLLAVTSLNRTGEPVACDIKTALTDFGDELVLMDDRTEQHKLQGSYPIVSLGREGARLERSHWLSGVTLMRNIMQGLPFEVPGHSDTINHSLSLEMEETLGDAYGPEARTRFIELVGWAALAA